MLKLKKLLIFICLIISTNHVFASDLIFNIEEVDSTECSSPEDAWERFSNEENSQIFKASDDFRRIYGNQMWQCRELLKESPMFQAALSYWKNVIEDNSNYDDSIKEGDRELLEFLYDINGESVPPEVIQRYVNHLARKKAACSAVDKRAAMPPIRDQDSIGWCYSYTAADLVSFKSGQNVSALDIALSFNRSENFSQFMNYAGVAKMALTSTGIELRERFSLAGQFIGMGYNELTSISEREGGRVDDSIERAMFNGGFCLERDLPSDSYDTANLGTMISAMNFFDGSFNHRRGMEEETAIEQAKYFCSIHGRQIGEIFDQAKVSDIAEVMIDSNKINLFEHLRDLECKNKVQIQGQIKSKGKDELNGNATAEIDKALDSGNIAGISYSTDLLGPDQSGGNHASSIVGRRWNEEGNKCEYLIRNSWGSSCVYYGDLDCENGHVWVEKDNVNEHVYKVTTFE